MDISSISRTIESSYGSPFKNGGAKPAASQPQDTNTKTTQSQSTPPVDEKEISAITYDATGKLPQAKRSTEQDAPDELEKSEDNGNGLQKVSETNEYSSEDQKEIETLEKRDQEVKTHEQAHIAAGGSYVRGGASFEYQTGPDGKRYAVGGEVSIDMSKESGNPQATIAKMQTIKRAALAPASPSGQDRAVAAKATRLEMEARSEAMEEADTTDMDQEGSPKTSSSQGAQAYTATMDASSSSTAVNEFA